MTERLDSQSPADKPRYPCHICADTMLPGITYTFPRAYDPTKPSCGRVIYNPTMAACAAGYDSTAQKIADCGFCKGSGWVSERRRPSERRLAADRRCARSAGTASIEPFVVKHYGVDPFPTIKGNGFDGLQVGEDREEAEDFIRWINERLTARSASEPLSPLADAVLAYDAAIHGCANDPEKMASFCTAQGDDLDALYLNMVNAAHDAKEKATMGVPDRNVTPWRAIWKYPLKVEAQQAVEMPIGAEILCVQVQHGIPVLWAKVSPGSWPQKRTIVIHPTGHEFEDYPGRYIGTVQMEGGMYVWHVYEAR